VGGSFAWTTPTTAPGAGTPSEGVKFTPSDTTDYNSPAAGSVSITVNQATPTVSSWPTASAITYGQTLASSTLSGGAASVGGSFAWTTPTTAPGAGTPSEGVKFTPSDTTDYNSPAAGSVSITVNQATPTITWATPPAITYGTVLSATQLNANLSVAGACAYTPAAGTILAVRTQTLSATCTPTDTTDYSTPSVKTVSLTVNPATLTVTANASRVYGAANPTFSPSYSGFVNGDSPTVLSGAPSLTTTAITSSAVGPYTIAVTSGTLIASNYIFSSVNGTLTVTKATPTLSITWSPTSPTHDHSVAFTCSATSLGQPVINGTVLTFLVDGTNVASVSSASGSSTWSISSLALGQHTVGCSSGDSIYNVVQVSQTLTIGLTMDTGTLTLTVNGILSSSATYGAGATPETVAASLVSGATASSPVTLSEVDGNLYMVANATGSASNYAYSLQATTNDPTDFTQASFEGSPASGNLEGGANTSSSGGTVYSYSIPSYVASQNPVGYDPVGNVVGYSDQVMGARGLSTDVWGFGYDTLYRLTGAAGSQTGSNGQVSTNYCWSYDAFGNRTLNYSGACTSGLTLTAYGTNNQLANGLVQYDVAGDLNYDSATGNTYLYDADGRICAVQSSPVTGYTTMTGYIYNGEGERVAKGYITTMSCDPTSNGFQTISEYVIGPGGEQLTEVGSDGKGSMAWVHTNVYSAGSLMATYDVDGLHFYLNDWLGSRRAQTDSTGVWEQSCNNLPFGDGLNCTGSVQSPTEHHYTGKERDAESGNDYFGARYYSSAMGRFMSPDWSAKEDPVPYADLEDPQSLNLYLYMQNNPLGGVDADGHLPPWIAQKMQQAKQWAADHPRTTMAVGGALLVTAAVVAAPEVLAAAAVAETVTEGLAVGTAALGVTGTAVNGTTQILSAATNQDASKVNEATNAVTAVTNPVAGGVSLATGSTEKGSQAGDLATVAKAGVGLTQGKAPNAADVASSLGGAKAAVSSIVHSVSGALAPTPSAPPAPAAPKPPPCATGGHC